MATEETLWSSMRYRFVATGIKPGNTLGKLWYKTIWDLVSDVISLRPGDNVLFWLYQRFNKPTGIVGIFEVDQVNGAKVFFDPRDVGAVSGKCLPLRGAIKPKKVYKVIAPDDLLLADVNYLPWVSALSAKKALGAFGGRGRSSTPIPPAGVQAIERALEEATKEVKAWDSEDLIVDVPETTESYPLGNIEVPITVDISNFKFPKRPPVYPGDIDFAKMPAVKPSGHFVVEKALEAWLMENADRPKNISCLLEDAREVLWFANYVPCSVSGVNMDAVITYKTTTSDLKFLVTELKVGDVYSNLEGSLKQVARYIRVARRLLLPSLEDSYGEKPKLEAAVLGFIGRGFLTTVEKGLVKELEQKLGVDIRIVGYTAYPLMRLESLYP